MKRILLALALLTCAMPQAQAGFDFAAVQANASVMARDYKYPLILFVVLAAYNFVDQCIDAARFVKQLEHKVKYVQDFEVRLKDSI